MYFKKRILSKMVAAILVAISMVMCLPINVQARTAVTKQQQILFIKAQLPLALEKEEEYGIPHELALAQGAWESRYGTSEFALVYHNYTGYACYPDDPDGPVICHESGQFASDEECWDAYFSLLAEDYGKANWYINAPKQLIRDIADIYCPATPGYADSICAMIDTVNSLESELVAMQEAEDAAAAEEAAREAAERERLMAALGDESIMIKDQDAEPVSLTAGATAAVSEMLALKETTVKEAADEVLAGNFGDYAERKEILGSNYDIVQQYIQYITLPA